MNFQDILNSRVDRSIGPTRATLIGVGEFGRSLIAQSLAITGLDLVALCDLDIARVIDQCKRAGLPESDLAICASENDAMAKRALGKRVVTDDPKVAIAVDSDVVVEATGNAEVGAENCLSAIENGRHIVLVTKETDSIVGPILSWRARSAGLVLSQVDGDQPSLLLALISWARMLGFSISCAGKASEFDFVYDPHAGTVHVEGGDKIVSVEPNIWSDPATGYDELVARRAELLSALPQRSPPDFCEMCIVANGSGNKPDVPSMHAPVARAVELPDLFRSVEHGGILAGRDRIDIFNCFRRPDEISSAGGVFAVLGVPDEETGRLYRAKGMPTSADAREVLVYNPTHLLGAEAPVSIMIAHRLGMATGSSIVRPVCDVAMRATADIPAGTELTGGHHDHRIIDIEPTLIDYTPLSGSAPVPYFLGIDRILSRPVKAGELIATDHLQQPDESLLWSLRREQDSQVFE